MLDPRQAQRGMRQKVRLGLYPTRLDPTRQMLIYTTFYQVSDKEIRQ